MAIVHASASSAKPARRADTTPKMMNPPQASRRMSIPRWMLLPISGARTMASSPNGIIIRPAQVCV